MTQLEKDLGKDIKTKVNDLMWEVSERIAKEAVPWLSKKGQELNFGKTVKGLIDDYEDRIYKVIKQ